MRGGTSRCLVFHEADLPGAGPARDRILLTALGSPDPYGRQLDGLGGGISSLSKACIIGPSSHPDADVDYTFAQVDVKSPDVDYAGNCGNCSSAVGPFAIDERMVRAVEGETLVRIHNTNTKKIIVARVPVRDGEAMVAGDFELAGVSGRGARIALDFLEPGGAATGRLLPTGHTRETIDGVEVSLVDATNPFVWVRAADLGLRATETPQAIDADRALMDRLEAIRVDGARRMGIPGSAAIPKIGIVAPPTAFTALDRVASATAGGGAGAGARARPGRGWGGGGPPTPPPASAGAETSRGRSWRAADRRCRHSCRFPATPLPCTTARSCVISSRCRRKNRCGA